MSQPVLSSIDREWPSAARIFPTEDPRAPGTIAGRIAEEIDRLRKQLAHGSASDWPDYKQRVGQIRGLEAALTICHAVEMELKR